MPPLYKPPIKVTQVEYSMLALVSQADPDYQRLKHWDIEYDYPRKNFYADPMHRGAYDTPSKVSNLNYAGPLTFAVGDLTGVGFDYVAINLNNPLPGVLTTRTASQMFGDIQAAAPLMQWLLRIANIGDGAPATIAGGTGVTVKGTQVQNNAVPIPDNTFTDFIMTFVDAQTVTMQVNTFNNSFGSVSH
jgi:hypothetical protein